MRIITDTSADILVDEAESRAIDLITLSVSFGDEEIAQATNEDYYAFYERLQASSTLPTTSRATLGSYIELFESIKAAGDEAIVLTLSSGLSRTIESAIQAKAMVDYDRIVVIDSRQASASLRLMTLEACRMRDEGKRLEEIRDFMLYLRDHVTIYGMIDTLENLKKGGRIPSSLAAIGGMLKLKPIIGLRDLVVQKLGMVRGDKKAYRKMIELFEADEMDPDYPVYFLYSDQQDKLVPLREEMAERFNLTDCREMQIGPVLGTHLGSGTVLLCYACKNMTNSPELISPEQ